MAAAPKHFTLSRPNEGSFTATAQTARDVAFWAAYAATHGMEIQIIEPVPGGTNNNG